MRHRELKQSVWGHTAGRRPGQEWKPVRAVMATLCPPCLPPAPRLARVTITSESTLAKDGHSPLRGGGSTWTKRD